MRYLFFSLFWSIAEAVISSSSSVQVQQNALLRRAGDDAAGHEYGLLRDHDEADRSSSDPTSSSTTSQKVENAAKVFVTAAANTGRDQEGEQRGHSWRAAGQPLEAGALNLPVLPVPHGGHQKLKEKHGKGQHASHHAHGGPVLPLPGTSMEQEIQNSPGGPSKSKPALLRAAEKSLSSHSQKKGSAFNPTAESERLRASARGPTLAKVRHRVAEWSLSQVSEKTRGKALYSRLCSAALVLDECTKKVGYAVVVTSVVFLALLYYLFVSGKKTSAAPRRTSVGAATRAQQPKPAEGESAPLIEDGDDADAAKSPKKLHEMDTTGKQIAKIYNDSRQLLSPAKRTVRSPSPDAPRVTGASPQLFDDPDREETGETPRLTVKTKSPETKPRDVVATAGGGGPGGAAAAPAAAGRTGSYHYYPEDSSTPPGNGEGDSLSVNDLIKPLKQVVALFNAKIDERNSESSSSSAQSESEDETELLKRGDFARVQVVRVVGLPKLGEDEITMSARKQGRAPGYYCAIKLGSEVRKSHIIGETTKPRFRFAKKIPYSGNVLEVLFQVYKATPLSPTSSGTGAGATTTSTTAGLEDTLVGECKLQVRKHAKGGCLLQKQDELSLIDAATGAPMTAKLAFKWQLYRQKYLLDEGGEPLPDLLNASGSVANTAATSPDGPSVGRKSERSMSLRGPGTGTTAASRFRSSTARPTRAGPGKAPPATEVLAAPGATGKAVAESQRPTAGAQKIPPSEAPALAVVVPQSGDAPAPAVPPGAV